MQHGFQRRARQIKAVTVVGNFGRQTEFIMQHGGKMAAGGVLAVDQKDFLRQLLKAAQPTAHFMVIGVGRVAGEHNNFGLDINLLAVDAY